MNSSESGGNNLSKPEKLTYKSSGVDVEKADKVVEWMKTSNSSSTSPHKDRLVSGIGGFAALFKGGFADMKEPLLVSSTDGIGTKLLMGLASGKTKGLAQDLVGMCVNDLLCTGAEPLFFLDYFATSNLKEDQLKEFFATLKEACTESGAALIGGETAELPGLYSDGHFDAAGFSVGVVDQEKAWTVNKVKDGDLAVAVSSSGFHSNGYSLLRKIFGENGGDYAQELMEPTKLYWPLVKALKENGLFDSVRVAAHITGGGMDNISRVVPEGFGVELQKWEWKDRYKVAMEKANLTENEMYKTFNCGIGFLMIVDKDKIDEVSGVVKSVQGMELVTSGKVCAVKSDQKWEIK
ncbi:MAG: phosphoribosylformylglycinamidine cyclo-ligase [Bdellovibrionales bacterium]